MMKKNGGEYMRLRKVANRSDRKKVVETVVPGLFTFRSQTTSFKNNIGLYCAKYWG